LLAVLSGASGRETFRAPPSNGRTARFPIAQETTANLLLRGLPSEDYALLAPHLQRAELPLRTALVEAGTPIDRVHFIESGVVSVLTDQEGGDLVEFGLFGYEGMSGMPLVLGVDETPHVSFVQVGTAYSLHLASDALKDTCRQSQTLHDLLLRYVHTLIVQSAATASANAHLRAARTPRPLAADVSPPSGRGPARAHASIHGAKCWPSGARE